MNGALTTAKMHNTMTMEPHELGEASDSRRSTHATSFALGDSDHGVLLHLEADSHVPRLGSRRHKGRKKVSDRKAQTPIDRVQTTLSLSDDLLHKLMDQNRILMEQNKALTRRLEDPRLELPSDSDALTPPEDFEPLLSSGLECHGKQTSKTRPEDFPLAKVAALLRRLGPTYDCSVVPRAELALSQIEGDSRLPSENLVSLAPHSAHLRDLPKY